MDAGRTIYGIDFSGAKDAGNKIWIVKGVVKGEGLLINWGSGTSLYITLLTFEVYCNSSRLRGFRCSRPAQALAPRASNPPATPGRQGRATGRVDRVVSRIRARDYSETRLPESKVCKECDLKALCVSEEMI